MEPPQQQQRQQTIHIVDRYILPIRALSYNAYYRIFRNRYITSNRGRQFKLDVKTFFDKIPNKRCHDCKIKMTIDFFFKTNRKTDTDNNMKSIIDACRGILYDDDDLIYEIHARKFIGQMRDEIHIEIENIDKNNFVNT